MPKGCREGFRRPFCHAKPAKRGRKRLTREEFIEMIDTGGDIMFDCDGRSYTILCWADGGPDIAEQVTEDNHRSFPDGEALVKGYIVNGKPLEERIAQIRITFCS